ncbi:hypothetical protein HPB51_005210 [Rhipicephalus microplus]|uniref:Uncharacterized protein n=1 Tax=Rhipicephalus microplus TaxID=6941 RepID=A0A9J6E6F8_RHIMP|nr:hypothetical protein HPB51_005210 [Rhipicephalus microplus]
MHNNRNGSLLATLSQKCALTCTQQRPRDDIEGKIISFSGCPSSSVAIWTEGRGISAAEYTASLKKIYTVNTVQGFWAVFHHIPDVCELGLRHTYHLMRGQRRPLWEDPENQRGGTWRIRCHKKHTPLVWKELILAAIGEQFAEDVRPGDDICGVSVCVRDRDDIVQLWNADARLSEGATVLSRVHALLPPGVTPVAEFYKQPENTSTKSKTRVGNTKNHRRSTSKGTTIAQ